MDGKDSRALLTQMVTIAPTMTHLPGLGFSGKMIARYLSKVIAVSVKTLAMTV